ncbi:hypothetical protein ACE6H2_022290 [Prunus campanulata]
MTLSIHFKCHLQHDEVCSELQPNFAIQSFPVALFHQTVTYHTISLFVFSLLLMISTLDQLCISVAPQECYWYGMKEKHLLNV